MLTDIFARRYDTLPLWKAFEEPLRRLLVQTFQLVTQIQPYYINGKESFEGKAFWGALHDLLARELGLQELSPKTWGYWTPQKTWASGTYNMHSVCERWMLLNFDGSIAADQYIKERLSLVEIGFRMHKGTISFKSHQTMAEAVKNDERALRKGFVASTSYLDRAKASIDLMNQSFNDAVNELNERFKHAGTHLNYHNGFIQLTSDEITNQEVEKPFWRLVSDPKWENVDYDMKEAIDRRDTQGRDPALYAGKALESTIKIISNERGLSTGRERGAKNYIDNLRGGGILEAWEAETLEAFFRHVRNPLSHGPGAEELTSLTIPQTNWAIETCMSWIKSLIQRLDN